MNGVAACLEYDTSSYMTPTFSSLDGHNAIWTSWDFLQIPTWPKAKTKNFLLWINLNRLCLHVGLEFWTIFSFTCSESTSFTTCKFCFSTLYLTIDPYVEYWIQSNLTLVAVKIRDNLTLRDKMKMTDFSCSKSPSK